MADENGKSVDDLVAEYESCRSTYVDFGSECERLLKSLISEADLSELIQSVESRPKDVQSLRGKLRRPDKQYTQLTDVTDLTGLRVITFFAEDVDKIASLIEREFDIDRENSVDRRQPEDPERFGYASLHYVCLLPNSRIGLTEYSRFSGLRLEIQLRSLLQHGWAEIHHDLGYKTVEEIPITFRRQFARLAGLLELADSEFDAIRTGLESYASSVSDKIRENPSTVQIDKASLVAYIAQDALVMRLDTELAAIWETELDSEPNETYAEMLVRLFKHVGFETIQDVTTALEEHERLVVDQFTREYPDLPRGRVLGVDRGASLFRLAHVSLAIAGGTAAVSGGLQAESDRSSSDADWWARNFVDAMPPGSMPPD